MVVSESRKQLKIKADQIKFKYWDKTSIIFHSREIGRKEGDFHILKDNKINKDFSRDLIRFLHQGNFQLFGVLVDKTKCLKTGTKRRFTKRPPRLLLGIYFCFTCTT